MSGAQIRITVQDEAVKAQLARLSDRARDLRLAFDEIGNALVASTVLRFERQTEPEGRRWRPSRAAVKRQGLTLVDTARLKLSITHEAHARSVRVGTNVVYAAIHQFGGEIRQGARTQTLAFDAKRRRFTSRAKARSRTAGAVPVAFAEIAARAIRMPARPFLGVSDDDRAEILDVLRRHLMAGDA